MPWQGFGMAKERTPRKFLPLACIFEEELGWEDDRFLNWEHAIEKGGILLLGIATRGDTGINFAALKTQEDLETVLKEYPLDHNVAHLVKYAQKYSDVCYFLLPSCESNPKMVETKYLPTRAESKTLYRPHPSTLSMHDMICNGGYEALGRKPASGKTRRPSFPTPRR